MDIIDYMLQMQMLKEKYDRVSQNPYPTAGEYEFLNQMNQIRNMQIMQARQQSAQQQQNIGTPPVGLLNEFAGGGSGGGSASAGGLGGGGIAGIIAAAIAAQHGLSTQRSREINGRKPGDVFSGNFATEPWYSYVNEKIGLDPLPGEKFDAAIKNKDYGEALNQFPMVANYWADPLPYWLGTGGEYVGTQIGGKTGGKIGSTVLNPIDAILRKIF